MLQFPLQLLLFMTHVVCIILVLLMCQISVIKIIIGLKAENMTCSFNHPVDSVEWIHDDSIIIGSIRVNADGSEEGYMVQVISSGAKKFTEVSVGNLTTCKIDRWLSCIAIFWFYFLVVIFSNRRKTKRLFI